MLTLFHLSIFQECSYDLKRFINYLIKKGIKQEGFFYLIYLFLYFLDINLVSYILLFLFFIFNFYRLKKKKVKVKFTKRLIRQIITLIIFLGFLLIYFKNIIYFYFFNNSFIILSYFFNYLIEFIIYKYYFNRTKKFLLNHPAVKIGITGSYGKTSVKNFLYQILKYQYATFMTLKSYNTPMGICKNMKDINKLDEVLIFEFGAAKKNDIKELMSLVNLDISILNSIGPQHLNTFKTLDNIVKEKTLIVDNMRPNKISFVCSAYKDILNHEFKKQIISYGFKDDDDFKISYDEKTNKLKVYKNKKLYDEYETSIIGKYNYLNILAAIAVSDYLHVNKDIIKKAVYNLKPIKNRMEIKKVDDYLTIIDDSYNSNIYGAIQALEILNRYECEKWIITPGFVEMDKLKKEHHRLFSKKIDQVVDNIILVNKKNTSDFTLKKDFIVKKSFNEAYKYFKEKTKDKKVVLLIENDLPDHY